MLLNLSQEERARLERLNKDIATVEGLKKLFLNACTKQIYLKSDVDVLAAERIAIEMVNDGFKELARIRPDTTEPARKENLV